MLDARTVLKLPRNAQSGVGLIEVLIAAFILAIGVLGIVSLLALSKVSQNEAIQRVRAISLADGAMERIRRNPAGLTVYDDRGYASPLGGGTITTEPSPNCNSASCDPLQMAAHDLWAWERLIDGNLATTTEGGQTINTAGLRGLRACIDIVADTGKVNTGIVSVVLQWQGLKETLDAVPSGGQTCGGAVANTDRTRRQVTISSYVIDETEI